jgi:hypothetical protein
MYLYISDLEKKWCPGKAELGKRKLINNFKYLRHGAQDWTRTSMLARYPLKIVCLPISPPGHSDLDSAKNPKSRAEN